MTTPYDNVRLRGNPVKAFDILRRLPAAPRELPAGALLAREEEARAEAARRGQMSRVRENRLNYRSDAEFFADLRRAQAGEEIELPEGENR
jgi:hypothetical protein